MNFETENAVLILDKWEGEEEQNLPFGKRYAHQLTRLTPEHLAALHAGKVLAIDAQGEYVVYLVQQQNNQADI